jgi:putative ABC transport system substrate-binding protein
MGAAVKGVGCRVRDWFFVTRVSAGTVALLLVILGASTAVCAQQPARVFRLGLLIPASSQAPPLPSIRAFLQRLEEIGYAEGRNLVIERRFSEERPERFPELAADLAQSKPDVIVAVSTPAALAAKQATQSIPTVMIYVGDPVGTGLVSTLGRPGGNMTGVSDMATDLSAKRVELLREAVPRLSRLAVLWNSADPGMVLRAREIERAARLLGLTMEPWSVRSPAEFDTAFASIAKKLPDAVFVVAEILTVTYRKRLLDFAATKQIPAMYEFGLFAKDGGLMAYGPDLLDVFRRGADYVDKLLKGAKPSDIPVEQPAKVGLVVNLKTAKALGLTIPQSVLIRADELIQ